MLTPNYINIDPDPDKKKKRGGRKCKRCKRTHNFLHPTLCNPCRQATCPHTDIHYDSIHAAICQCGKVMAVGNRKKNRNMKRGQLFIHSAPTPPV
jgi:hypothetical protein